MKLQILTSTVKDGIMSADRIYFPTLAKEERTLLYDNTINRFAQKIGLSKENVIVVEDSGKKITVGKASKNKLKMKNKIVLLKSTLKDFIVAVPTSDDPVLIANVPINDQESISAIAKITIDNLNNNILHEVIEVLIKETNKDPFEMTFYISACPFKENLELNSEENILSNPIFKKAITKNKNKYYFDIRYAIFDQLVAEIVDPNYIYFSEIDTATDKNFFSTIGQKLGKQLVCVVYQDEEI